MILHRASANRWSICSAMAGVIAAQSNAVFPAHIPDKLLAVNIVLNPAEARVLGALMEKDITPPDYYPFS